MPRPELREVPLDLEVLLRAKQIVLTISVGQPMTTIHRVGYDMGCYLLELDDDEHPVRCYHTENPKP